MCSIVFSGTATTGVYVIKASAQTMNGMLCNIVLFHLFKSQTERLWTGNTNIEYIFQQFASEIFKQLPEPPANINFCNKQCKILTSGK